jgi:hypothetical protein
MKNYQYNLDGIKDYENVFGRVLCLIKKKQRKKIKEVVFYLFLFFCSKKEIKEVEKGGCLANTFFN